MGMTMTGPAMRCWPPQAAAMSSMATLRYCSRSSTTQLTSPSGIIDAAMTAATTTNAAKWIGCPIARPASPQTRVANPILLRSFALHASNAEMLAGANGGRRCKKSAKVSSLDSGTPPRITWRTRTAPLALAGCQTISPPRVTEIEPRRAKRATVLEANRQSRVPANRLAEDP